MKKLKKVIQTFIGPEATLDGRLVFEGALRIDGRHTGTLESKDGTIIVSESAVVHADILVQTAIVRGEVKGNIIATERIELHPSARVFGNLSAPVVVIDAGVVFEGNCTAKPKDDSAGKTIGVPSAP